MNTGGQSDPTRPWSNNGNDALQPTMAWNTEDGSIQQQINLGLNPTQLAYAGFDGAIKKIAGVAIAYTVVKNVASVVSKATAFVADVMAYQSGNFGYVHGLSNLRQEWYNVHHPFSMTLNMARETYARKNENERRTLNLALLGETMISRGV